MEEGARHGGTKRGKEVMYVGLRISLLRNHAPIANKTEELQHGLLSSDCSSVVALDTIDTIIGLGAYLSHG